MFAGARFRHARNLSMMSHSVAGTQASGRRRIRSFTLQLNVSLRSRTSSMPSRFGRVFSSTVGTKLLMGLTGLALFAYMLLHLAGNVIILAGPELFNEYSHTLISNPLILPIELALLAIFVIHIYKAIRMWMANNAARPVAYTQREMAGHTSRKSLASSTMIWSGLFIMVFVVIHVQQFKFGTWYQTVSDSPIRDLYRTEVEVF